MAFGVYHQNIYTVHTLVVNLATQQLIKKYVNDILTKTCNTIKKETKRMKVKKNRNVLK